MTRVTVIIKAWLILPCAAIPENLMRKVIQAFTYTNPDFIAAQRAKRRTFSIPPKICTAKFYAAKQAWVFPRGGATKLREVIEQFENFEVVWDDRRTVTEPIDFELPTFEPRAYQLEAVKQLIKRQQGILIGGTGCVSGDTIIRLNRNSLGRKTRIDAAFKGFHGLHKNWKYNWINTPTYIRSLTDDGIRLHRVREFVQSGIKDVFELVLEDGKTLKATACHPILTTNGFKPLGELDPSTDLVIIEGEKLKRKGKSKKKFYPQIRSLKFHPYAGKTKCSERGRMYRVPKHRAVAEATASGISLADFIFRCRVSGDIKDLKFFDPAIYAVHHKDENHLNNDPNNLIVLTHEEHAKLHGDYSHFGDGVPAAVGIKSVKFHGREMTYDVVCEDPHRNFVANGIVVHNSGKSLTSIAAAVATGQRTMVIVWNRDLISYWREEILKSGYLKEEDIGLIWGKERRHGKITIAMQQTLLGKDVKEFAHLYGCVIIDECDRQPARSFVTVMSQFSAKYRWGVTADETRRDGKEFIAYDVLGPVIHRFEQTTVTAPPFVTFIPTAFKYKDYNPKKYFEFLEALLADEERNNLIARHLYHELKAGHRILLFCGREEYVTMWYEYVQHTLGFESGTLMGGLKNARVCGRTTKEVIDGVNAGKIQFVAGTSYCDKALNMPILDTGFFICPAAADLRRMNQQVGRIVREYPGKEYARIFYFVDEKMSRIKSRVKFIKAKWPKWKYWGEE